MSNVGREVKQYGEPLGVVVDETTKRGKTLFKVKLADGQPRNLTLGDFGLYYGGQFDFADAPVFAEPTGFVDLRIIARRQSYNR